MAFSKVSQSSYKLKAEKKNKKKVTKMLLWKLVWGKKNPRAAMNDQESC